MIGAEGLATDDVRGGLASIPAVEVQRNARIKLYRCVYSATMGVDHRGFTNFREVCTVEAGH
jgi:hypothetical protein